MIYRNFIISLFSLLTITACANTPTDSSSYVPQSRPYLPIEVSVLSDNKGSLPEYPVTSDASHYRAYVQATKNDRYRIRISNNTDQRVGVVIAVDGRNIISGQKSYLLNTERMYILNPRSSGEYEGWRTGDNQVNRFYFTEDKNSYAAAWGDNSAMGVIAMVVYPEYRQPEILSPGAMMKGDSSAARSMAQESAPGTGYGETTYSPSMSVSFEPLPDAIEKVFLKYEWRETLCKKGIAPTCQAVLPSYQNRFWPDNNGYASPPPRLRY